jgi:PBP1b-binding outer membrane lipoprotein LpoB
MKTQILSLLTFLTLVFTSCSKDDNGNDNASNQNYFIKAKINGQPTEYKVGASATLPLNGKTISGYAKAPNQPFPAFGFEITDLTGIKVQNYTEPNNSMIFRLAIEGTVTYHSQHGGVEDFNIDIAEITNNYVKGTFSGKVFLAQSFDGTNFTLAEGEFFLKRNLE